MYSSILFPVDLEHDGSWKTALPKVRKFAEAFGAHVHVVTVVAETRGTLAAEFFPADFEQKVVDRARERIGEFIERHLSDLKGVDAYVETGRPYRVIVALAERLDCDLIVMASEKPDLLDILIGPNAENIIRHSGKSILVVRD